MLYKKDMGLNVFNTMKRRFIVRITHKNIIIFQPKHFFKINTNAKYKYMALFLNVLKKVLQNRENWGLFDIRNPFRLTLKAGV